MYALKQNGILAKFRQASSTSTGFEFPYLKANAHVVKLTHPILAKAFCGELVSQDPGDEPPSLLLERTRETDVPQKRGRKREGNFCRCRLIDYTSQI